MTPEHCVLVSSCLQWQSKCRHWALPFVDICCAAVGAWGRYVVGFPFDVSPGPRGPVSHVPPAILGSFCGKGGLKYAECVAGRWCNPRALRLFQYFMFSSCAVPTLHIGVSCIGATVRSHRCLRPVLHQRGTPVSLVLAQPFVHTGVYVPCWTNVTLRRFLYWSNRSFTPADLRRFAWGLGVFSSCYRTWIPRGCEGDCARYWFSFYEVPFPAEVVVVGWRHELVK